MFPAPALGADGLRVNRMRIGVADGDGLRARQRVEAQLAGVGASGLGLPPRSLLFVRHVAAALDISRPPADNRAASRALQAALSRRVSGARRPWIDPDAARADAVLFTDEAELIACLIRDWRRGLVGDRWWWPSVLAGVSPEWWFRGQVLQRGHVLVPALSLLEPRSEIVPWIGRLDQQDARLALASVVRAFALRLTVTAADLVPAGPSPIVEDPSERSTDGAIPHRDAPDRVSRLVALVPELRTVTLPRVHRHLLVVVLTVCRAPSWARTSECARAIVELDRPANEPGALPDHRRAIATNGAPAERAPISGSAPAVDDPRRDTAPVFRAATTREEARPVPGRPPLTPAADSPVEAVRATPLRPALPPAVDGVEPSASVAIGAPLTWAADVTTRPAGSSIALPPLHQSEATSATPQLQVEGAPVSGASVETEYGGIFYLLNAWMAMGIYADFTAPRGDNFVLSPWDLLALVGRAWFGHAFVHDPVWTTLADLAVRDPGVDPDRDSALPVRWLDEHLEALIARLRLALGATDEAGVPALVCHHHARIEVSAATVGVHLRLCALPLELRFAGLDRDPGWMPAAGRSVYFHFA
jgi:hypothetical protein